MWPALRILLIVAISLDVASGQDAMLLIRSYCPRKKLDSAGAAQVNVRAWPLNAMSRTIPPGGATLNAVLAEPLLLSLPPSFAYYYGKSGFDPATADTDGTKLMFRPGTTNTVIVGRGNRILVFPRILLLHPSIGNLPLQDGDFVATMLAQQNPRDEAIVADGLQRLLLRYQGPATVSDPALGFGGPLLPIPAGVQNLFAALPEPSNPLVPPTLQKPAIFSAVTKIEKYFGDGPPNIPDASCPIFVLTRKAGDTLVVYACPLRDSGLFRADGPILTKLANAGEEEARSLWNYHCDDSMDGDFLPGDTIEFTHLESFVLTSGFGI